MEGIVVRQLKMAQRWLVLQQFVDYAVWALAAGLTVLALSHAVSLNVPKSHASWPIIFLVPLAFAALAGIYRWRSLRAVAREIDARVKAKDRFLTALALPASEAGALCDAVHRETSAFASSLPLRKFLRLELPRRRALWLLPPLVALAFLEGVHQWRASTLAPELAVARKLVEQARRNAELEVEKEKEFQKVAEQLQDTERELATSPQPLREALRTLAELEQRLSPQSELSAAETLALAEALAQNHAKLASDLRAGKNAEAGKAAAQLDPAELASALEQAARHLESRRLRELANQAPAAARLTLGMMLGSPSGNGDEMGRRRFVSALRDMKNGIQGAGQGGAQGLEASEPRQPGGEKSPASALDNAPPGGAPGSENDPGRGKDLSQENEGADQTPGSEDFIAGQTGEGASLVELFHTAGNDDPRARRAYHSAYQAAEPAALDAVSHEQIPAGSRLLVRRYFEAIRPKE
jgi:hypothetical protein